MTRIESSSDLGIDLRSDRPAFDHARARAGGLAASVVLGALTCGGAAQASWNALVVLQGPGGRLADIAQNGTVSNLRTIAHQSDPNFSLIGLSRAPSGTLFGHSLSASGSGYTNHLFYLRNDGSAGNFFSGSGTGLYALEGDNAVHPVTGAIYVVHGTGSLWTFGSGSAAQLVGAIPGSSDPSAAAFSPSGQLWVLDLANGGRLRAVSTANASVSQSIALSISAPNLSILTGNAGMAFDPTDANFVYAVVPVYDGSSISQHMLRIALATGVATDQGVVTVGGWPTTQVTGLVVDGGPSAGQNWYEDLDQHQAGAALPGLGGWSSWDDDAAAGDFAVSADIPAHSGDLSLGIDGPDDAVRVFEGFVEGSWTFETWIHVPADFVGTEYVILLNTYESGGAKNWSLQLEIDGAAGVIRDFDQPGVELPIEFGTWKRLRDRIDLDADVQTVFYGDDLLVEKSWTDGASGGGVPAIAALDLWGNGSASPVYYDSFALLDQNVGACCLFDPAGGTMCLELSPGGCRLQGGVWSGGRCADVVCDLGACCYGDVVLGYSCIDSTSGSGIDAATCASVYGGTWTADSPCGDVPCGPQTGCLGDIDLNAVVDFGDLVMMLASWGSCADCPADLDFNDLVDFQDLLALLGNWGMCP